MYHPFIIGEQGVMGLFSKFNVKAVDQAYKDLVAVQFVSMVAVQTLDSCEYGGTCVDVGPICDEVALAIGKSLYINADGGLELGAAIQRLDIVSSSIKRDLITKFGHNNAADGIGSELHSRFEAIAPRLLKAAKKGYVKFSVMDAVNLVERYEGMIDQALYRALERGDNYGAELEKEIEEESVRQSYSEEDFLSEVDRRYEEAGNNNSQACNTTAGTKPHPKTKSKITDPLILHCQKCSQSLNVPKGKKLKVSCPTCGNSWVHDGTSNNEKRSFQPTEIRVKREGKVLEISFVDGNTFTIPAELLRVESPSPDVQGQGSSQKTIVAGRRHVSIIAAEPVGNYAVCLKFDDLHDTGIYTWETLYNLGVNQDTLWQVYVDALAEKGLSREPSNTPKDKVEKKVEKSDAERVTNFADRPKSKLQLREEQARQALEKKTDKANPDYTTQPPTDVDYVEEASADVVRKLNEEKRIAEEKRQAWAEHEIERGRKDRDELQRVREMHSVKAPTNNDVAGKENITSNEASFREQHKATIERRELRLVEERRKKEEELQAKDNRKAERKKKDREDRLKLREKKNRGAAAEKTVPRPETTYKRMPIHAPLSLPRCPDCNQALNIDRREKNVACPKCGFLLVRGDNQQPT
jgi:DUF971 family protein/predicted RNA-binding Zn-ribbon protein involved in translation (DUF1610 family)